MRKLRLLAILVVGLVSAGVFIAASPNSNRNFVAHLAGGNEVPANASLGQGEAIFHLSKDGLSLDYQLNVANIDNVTASHIHIAPAGVNGSVTAFLYGPAAPGGGRTDGVLAKGTITAASLIGPLAGHPLSDLVAAMNSGGAYVNAHTNDGVPPVGTGPGDLPTGEIRGQIQ